VAWSACNGSACQLYVRTLDRYLEEQLPGTSGGSAPFFSPDERWLGFFAGGKLKKVWLAGGATPTVITEAAHPLGAVWMLDGRIIFAASPTGGLMQVSENGGNPGVLTTPAVAAGEIAHVFPSAIRGGAALLFTVITSPLRGAPGRLALLSSTRPRGSWQAIVEDVNIGLALRDEYLLFARRHQLHAVAFDKARQAAAGPEQTIGSLLPPHLAVSESGAMVAVDAASVEPPRSPPARWAWVGGAGPDIHEQIEPLLDPQLSPDGSRIAGVSGDVRPDIWIADLQRGTTTRLTYSAGVASPVWSGTADEVFYTSRQAAGFEIRARSLSSDGADRVVLSRQDRHVFPASVSKVGDLAFTETGGPTGSDIGLARRDGTVTLVVQTPFDERGPTLSPDGTLMAFETDETGRPEIAILRLNDSRRMPVSTAGGSGAFWSADGGTLFFARGDDLIRVLVDSDGQVSSPPLVLERLNGSRPVGASRSGAVLVHWTEPPFAPSATLTLEAIKELRRVVGRPTPTIPR
jgi:serine/threonine-protein kinase